MIRVDTPGVQNSWNWKSPVPLSAGYNNWTLVFVDLSEMNFHLGVDWQPGCDFNLDELEGIAVLILSNGSDRVGNIIDLDNIQLLTNKNKQGDSDVMLRLQLCKRSNFHRFWLYTFKNQLTKECAGGDSIKAHRHNLTD